MPDRFPGRFAAVAAAGSYTVAASRRNAGPRVHRAACRWSADGELRVAHCRRATGHCRWLAADVARYCSAPAVDAPRCCSVLAADVAPRSATFLDSLAAVSAPNAAPGSFAEQPNNCVATAAEGRLRSGVAPLAAELRCAAARWGAGRRTSGRSPVPASSPTSPRIVVCSASRCLS